MENILSINNLNVSINKKEILEDITVNIKRNKITSIIGPSGGGKSTFLKSLVRGIEGNSKVSGDIMVNGENINNIKTENLRKNIGLVFQTPTPFPFSIYKNMIYAPKYYGIKKKSELENIVIDNLKKVSLYDEVKENLDMDARRLSGGQQQRLCIARSLTVNPEIILLDEPCSALDVKNISKIEETLVELKKDYTIVIATHNLSQARRISDYIMFISDGKLIEYKGAEGFFKNPENILTKEYIEYMEK